MRRLTDLNRRRLLNIAGFGAAGLAMIDPDRSCGSRPAVRLRKERAVEKEPAGFSR